MTYTVDVEEQIWYLTTYQVEADSPEEAENLVMSGEGVVLDKEEKEVHDMEVLNVTENLW